MPEFFEKADFAEAESGFILLRAKRKTLKIPNKVPKSFFDEDLKNDLKHDVVYDADIHSSTIATLVARDSRSLSCASADWAIWSAYITGGKIFVRKEMLSE